MKKQQKLLSGIMALAMLSSLAACTDDNNSSTTTEGTTTTQATVAINSETLKEEEAEALNEAGSQLSDVTLENKTIKWLAHYDINPDTTGKSKSTQLEMFETKYGGNVQWYPTTYEARYTDLSNYILGGEGIDFFPGDDSYNFPKGIVSGMFQSVDDYVDLSSPLFAHTAPAYELFNFGGKHYQFVTEVTPFNVCFYNAATIEEFGFDDPYELWQDGKWNWDTFKEMLLEFVDEDAERYGLDEWYFERALTFSAGVPFVGLENGNLVCNVNDPTIEKAMNFGYELYTNGLIYPFEQFGWSTHGEFIGSGNELFMIKGIWEIYANPEIWSNQTAPEDLKFVPVPNPADSDRQYQDVKIAGFALCTGAQNPQGVSLFAECTILSTIDESIVEVNERKTKDDYGWTDFHIDAYNQILEIARQNPVMDFGDGCSTDIASLCSGDHGYRNPFRGTDWATERETIADTLTTLVAEIDAELKAKMAE